MEVYTIEEINKAIGILEHVQDSMTTYLDGDEYYEMIEEVILILAQEKRE
jgi:hypothetical protein